MVHPLVQARRDDLERLCAEHHVRRLAVFGSATTSGFDRDRSDLDFLVEFEALEPEQHADAYFGLLNSLEALFDRSVDLVEPEGVRNPYVQAAIDRTQVQIYAAA